MAGGPRWIAWTIQRQSFVAVCQRGSSLLLQDGAVPTRPPANMWNHSRRRARLRHLTDQPPCVCGAGRDISFLYDVAPKERPGQEDASVATSAIPDTLIPEEYHIVKHPGVMGLEFHDECVLYVLELHLLGVLGCVNLAYLSKSQYS